MTPPDDNRKSTKTTTKKPRFDYGSSSEADRIEAMEAERIKAAYLRLQESSDGECRELCLRRVRVLKDALIECAKRSREPIAWRTPLVTLRVAIDDAIEGTRGRPD